MSTPTTNLTPEALARIEAHRQRRFPKPQKEPVVIDDPDQGLTDQELGFLFGQLISCPVGFSEGLVL